VNNHINPRDGSKIFIIDVPHNLKQYHSQTSVESIGAYKKGEEYNLNVSIGHISNLNSLDVYLIEQSIFNGKTPEEKEKMLDGFRQESDFNLMNNPIFQKLTRKFNRYNMSPNENDYVLKLDTTSSTIQIGNGIYGKKLKEGDGLLIRVKTTEGKKANVNTTEFEIDNVSLNYKTITGGVATLSNTDKVTLKGMSVLGSAGGTTLDNVEEFRRNLLNHIYSKQSIVTQKDFKIFFHNFNKKPPAVYSSQVLMGKFIWIYNTMHDDHNRLIHTNTLNILSKPVINGDDFMITKNDGLNDYKSPWFLRHDPYFNMWNAYLINPEQQVTLTYPGEVAKLENQQETKVLKQIPNLFITYDYKTKKSHIELRQIRQEMLGATYYFKCKELNAIALSASNGWKSEIPNNPGFIHDKYCFIEKDRPMHDIVITNDLPAGDMVEFKGPQTPLYQDYFVQNNPTVILDNIEYIIKIPMIDQADWNRYSDKWLYDKLMSTFKSHQLNDQCVYDVQLVECFSNTRKIKKKYMDLVFKQNDSNIERPNHNFDIYLDIDSYQFSQSYYKNTSEFESDLKLDLLRWFEQNNEGHDQDYYEDKAEQYITSTYPFVKNARIPNLLLYKLHDENEIQRLMLDKINNKHLSKIDIIEYVPYYFSVDDFRIHWKGE